MVFEKVAPRCAPEVLNHLIGDSVSPVAVDPSTPEVSDLLETCYCANVLSSLESEMAILLRPVVVFRCQSCPMGQEDQDCCMFSDLWVFM